ncbi:hypothetical protein ACLOJK_002611 [Asimina triloba]
MVGNPWIQVCTCKDVVPSSILSVSASEPLKFAPYHLPRVSRKCLLVQVTSANAEQIPSPYGKRKNPLSVILDATTSIWKRRPVGNFGFGKRSIWEGGVGLFIMSGAVLLALTVVWLRGFRIRSQLRKYEAVLEFAQACGISEGTPVRIRGVTVGTVVRIVPTSRSVNAVAEMDDEKIIIPKNALIEVNQSGLLMETMIDITPRVPLPSPSAGPLDSDCVREGLIVCNREKIAGNQGVSLDELIGILTRLGREMEQIGVSKSYALAEKVSSVLQDAKPLLTKAEAIAQDVQPLLSEVRDSGLLKELESLTKSLTEATKELREVHSSILTPENTELIHQSIYILIFTLKNIERISSNISGFTSDDVMRQNLKFLIKSLSRLL